MPKKSISVANEFCFVAERRLNLARPFKAGVDEASEVTLP